MKHLLHLRKIHVVMYYALKTASAYRTVRAMKKVSTRPPGAEELSAIGSAVGAGFSALYADPWKDQA